MKTSTGASRPCPESTSRKALRALRRAVRAVRAENRRSGLPLLVWKNGKVIEIKP
ncbi:MAG: hypothetical protein HYY24_25295 [Verrucomicrobia bacterium]|nr:hypothetical protein [Verrucomicrobiota bacterium]